MLNLVRFALQCVIALLLVGSVIGFFAETGTAEKVVLVAFAAGLVYAAARVRRLGANRQPASSS